LGFPMLMALGAAMLGQAIASRRASPETPVVE
jgi:hypothetical protein